jgi:uncharacterized delta-60 repeat protein
MFCKRSSSPRKLSLISLRLGLVLAVLVGLLALFPPALARADLTPGALDTGFDPGSGANGLVQAVTVQPDGKVLVGGSFTHMDGTACGHIARLNGDGSLDPLKLHVGTNGDVRGIAVQPDGKILIGGNFTQVDGADRNYVARLYADGSLDASFNPGDGPDGSVEDLALQPDGKVLVGGYFTQVDGVVRNHVARLNTDGSLDTSFDPGTGTNDPIEAVALQPDGKVLIGGRFTQVNDFTVNRIARLNENGTLDMTFIPGAGADYPVYAIVVQPDGKVLVGGSFIHIYYTDTVRRRIARLNGDGSLDSSFSPAAGASDIVRTISLQTDGKIIIGGWFTEVNGEERNRIARLNGDGSLDASFDPGDGPSLAVEAVAAYPHGKAIIGGYFTEVSGEERNRIARLNTDGSSDTGFTVDTSESVLAVAVQPDGKILIGGTFTQVNGETRNHIARLNADGSLDTGFSASTSGNVSAVVVQPDGKILIGGSFTQVNGVERRLVARLNADGSLDTGFSAAWEASGSVYAVALQPDGKVVVGGRFTHTPRRGGPFNNVARFNADGSLDFLFHPILEASHPVYAVAVVWQGYRRPTKILIGGMFTQVNGETRNHIARLNENGSLDTSFDPGNGPSSAPWAIVVQPDGKVLIGGEFLSVNGYGLYNHIARLDADGSVDLNFSTQGVNGNVYDIALQSDGNILIGGTFTWLYSAYSYRNRIARLWASGSPDGSFNTSIGANDTVRAVAVQPDGQVVIGGEFTEVDGQPRNHVARLNGATAPTIVGPYPPSRARVGLPYSHTFIARGFPVPTFYVSTGSLPPGLTLDAISGELSGTPTVVGEYDFTVAASNYVALSAFREVTLVVG